MGLLALMFGTGGSSAKESTDEEKYSVLKSNEEREVRDAEYREVSPIKQPLTAKMWGGGWIKRTPEEEEKIRKAKAHEELKKSQKKQAEAAKRKEHKEAFDNAYKEEEIKIKARKAARHDNRQLKASAYVTAPPYQKVYISAFGMVRASKPSTVSYKEHGVYPYDLLSMGVSNAFVVAQSGMGRLSNPMFDGMFGSSGRYSNGKSKGIHPLASFGFTW